MAMLGIPVQAVGTRGRKLPVRRRREAGAGAQRLLPVHDPERLGSLLRALEPRLVAVALRLTRDREAARDVVQSAFEKAIRNGHRFRGSSRVSTWLQRIVTNEALMWLRTERRRRQRMVELDAFPQTRLSDPAPSAHELLVRRQSTHRLRAGLALLTPEERELLTQCALEGRSYADLARQTGSHPAALKSRAFRARRHLSVILQDA